MTKVNFGKIAKTAAKVAAPVVAAAVIQRVTTGRIDLRRLALDLATQALSSRPQA